MISNAYKKKSKKLEGSITSKRRDNRSMKKIRDYLK